MPHIEQHIRATAGRMGASLSPATFALVETAAGRMWARRWDGRVGRLPAGHPSRDAAYADLLDNITPAAIRHVLALPLA